MRIGIGALHHETNSFSNILANWAYMSKTRCIGDSYLRVYTNRRNYSGGFIDKAKELGIELVPAACAYLCPSGHITDEALEKHRDGIVSILWQAHQEKPLDAIALNLHGAGVADSYPDADGEILRAVREKFGPDMPIGCVLDLHANVTREMMEYADLLTGVKGYPHVDEYEAGAEMLEILADMAENNWRPCMRLVQLPWLIVPAEGVTLNGPAHDVQQLLYKYEQENDDLINATFFHGFPYSDIEQAGVSVTTVAKTQEAADRNALEIARYAWNRRRDFAVPANSAETAMDLAEQIPITNGPVVIHESSDNTGGGAPGDGTYLLREMLKRDLPGSAFGTIYDPEVVAQAVKAGVGAKISCKLGGKMDNLHGEPIELTDAYVRTITDGSYMNLSPMGRGPRNIGMTVLLVVGNVNVIVTCGRSQAMDDGFFRMVGLRHDLLQYVAVKSSQHFKGWWKDYCSGIVPCDSPGIHCADLHVFDFKFTNTGYFPLADATWEEA